MMTHDNDSIEGSNELKELLTEFQSLFGALEIEEDTNTIDIIDEDLITSGITDSIRLTHQSKQEKENRTTISKKHSRDDNSSDAQQLEGSKRLCRCQGNRNRSRSGIRRGYEVESESFSSEEDTLSDDS